MFRENDLNRLESLMDGKIENENINRKIEDGKINRKASKQTFKFPRFMANP